MRSSATPSSRSRSRWTVRSWASVEQRAYPINVSVMTGSVRIAPDIRDFHRTGYLRRSRPRSQPAGRAGGGRAWRVRLVGTVMALALRSHVGATGGGVRDGAMNVGWLARVWHQQQLAWAGAVTAWERRDRRRRFGRAGR